MQLHALLNASTLKVCASKLIDIFWWIPWGMVNEHITWLDFFLSLSLLLPKKRNYTLNLSTRFTLFFYSFFVCPIMCVCLWCEINVEKIPRISSEIKWKLLFFRGPFFSNASLSEGCLGVDLIFMLLNVYTFAFTPAHSLLEFLTYAYVPAALG